ncbi:hypothetical protein BDN70DRAFT_830959 [Pholiota conissans]|uniref:F-box domain-containing protein n=1 Tax=Pholiota conissans TaxID=109636 RepID=A0A9P5Z5L3_9AGAR|nr:hypothetical protein BDN70DRAFT_830959 [Pholiota conissans]
MHGPLPLDDNVGSDNAHERIIEAIRQHQLSIDQHRASILALKSQYNDFAYVSRLSPDILYTIFSLAQRDNAGAILPYSFWTQITHVNRRWRDIAVNSPCLWSELHFGNIQWLHEALKRSKDADLDISILRSSFRQQSAIKEAVKHKLRFRSLHIYDTMSAWNVFIDSCPRLESFSVETDHIGGMSSFAMNETMNNWGPITTTQDFLRNAQRLRSLRLINLNIRWKSSSYFHRTLTRLTIEDLPLHSKPTVAHFVLAMKEMPELEFLHLTNAFPVADRTSFQLPDSIHFSRLRKLLIVSSVPSDLETFFKLITFPPNAMVKVRCISINSSLSSTDISRIISAFGTSYSLNPSEIRFQTFMLIEYSNGSHLRSFQARLFTGTLLAERMDRNTFDDPDANIAFDFIWETHISCPSATSLVAGVFSRSMSLQDIRHVYLDTEDPEDQFTREMLLSTFGKLPRLRYVLAGGLSGRPFIDALALGSTERISSVERAYFLKLSSVCLFDVRITSSNSAPNPGVVPIDVLQDCFIRYHQNYNAIPVLTFKKCHGLGRPENAQAIEDMLRYGALPNAST